MTDPGLLAVAAATFVLAGLVKGVIGLGLPTVSLAVLAAAYDLTTAMALMLAPSLVTNAWQAVAGSETRAVWLRVWPFLAAAAALVWAGSLVLAAVDTALLAGLLGLTLMVYAGLGLVGFRFAVPPGAERWAGPLFGAVNGVLTGMTGSFVVPGVLYLQAIGLGRDMLVQAMGMLFTVSTLALVLALGGQGLLGAGTGAVSVAGILPALLGMALGRRIRRRLSEARFRRVFLAGILLLGAWILLRAGQAV